MCRVLEVSKAGFYEYLQRPALNEHDQEDQELSRHIESLFTQSQQTYGQPRLKVELKKLGYQVSRARIGRLMSEMGLVAKASKLKRKSHLSRRALGVEAAGNKLAMNFEVEHLNQVGLADMSELVTPEGKLYISSVLDLKSRFLLGWSVREDASVQGPLDALLMAKARRQGQSYRGCMHHSDQGSVYTSQEYQQRLVSMGLVASFSDVGKCYDNAPKESWFGSLKVEKEWTRGASTSKRETRAALIDYIEAFYNRKRIHSSLGYLSPLEFEALYWLEQQEILSV